ncbi:MAG: hypothetical protein ACJA0X_003016 [Cyclobacteriaceae bacterium]|jgi:uncharacterized protein YceK
MQLQLLNAIRKILTSTRILTMKFKMFFVVLCISGCASVPWITPPSDEYTVVNSKSYDKSYDDVWAGILGYLSDNKAMIKSADKSNGLITAELSAFEDAFADCGKDSSMNITGRSASINILIRRSNENVVATVNNEFLESRQMMQAFTKTPCNSKGALETSILDSVAG